MKELEIEYVKGLPILELADMYPYIDGEGFDDLVESIKIQGLLVPLLIWNDHLIDGRNRLRASIIAGLEKVLVDEFEGTIEEAEDCVIALNENRRHLLPVQRAYIADKHRALVSKRAKERQSPGRNQYSEPEIIPNVNEAGTTRAILAKKHYAGINSIDTVQRIRRVSEETMWDSDSGVEVKTPKAIKANAVLTKMQRGTITISDAVKTVFGETGQNIRDEPCTEAFGYVYKAFNIDGVCLYVGSTDDPKKTQFRHARNNKWFKEADENRWVWKSYSNIDIARQVEKEETAIEDPVYNKYNNGFNYGE